ncbi:MAG TPA: LysR family transcriptional regulator [Rhizomicrobium sp.]|jgi:DNA-binding transcriptional LysR family regulator
MRQKKESRVRANERVRSNANVLNWEGARIFLAVSRHKSIRAAAIALDQSVNALRAQIASLERQLGTTLFTRHVDGVRLTEEGQRVLVIAQRMELDAFDLVRAAGRSETSVEGMVRLSATEGIGSFWIAPGLIAFQRDNPRVLIDLQCQMSIADVLRLEADVAVQLARPMQKDVRVVKLGRMHLYPFAAASYIAQHGMPKSVADFPQHRLAVQVSEQLTPVEEYLRQLGSVSASDQISIRSNVSSAHYWAIATGIGIGLLPTYAVALGANLVPIDLNLRFHHDIWLVYHPDASRIPRVRNLIDWLIDRFSAQRFPWFADEFLHPNDFPKSRAGLPDENLVDVFVPNRKPRAR